MATLSARDALTITALTVAALAIPGACSLETKLTGSGAPGGSVPTSSSTTETTSTTIDPTDNPLGLACDDAQPCGISGICLRATDTVVQLAELFGQPHAGGPAGGYCSRACDTDRDCPGEGSLCFTSGASGICLLGCALGAPALDALDDPLDESKCHGRDDAMCTPLTDGGAVCVPVCGSDADCAQGRGCDYASGLCVDTPRLGSPLGAACQPDRPGTAADEDPCAGFCLSFVDELLEPVSHLCSARCSLGGPVDQTTNCGGSERGLCAFAPLVSDTTSAGLGDFGFCTGACTAHDTCNFLEGHFCFDLGLTEGSAVGYCFAAVPCPVGDECGDDLCRDTRFGPVCLQSAPDEPEQPRYPLGLADVGAGGGGWGGGGGATGGAGGAAGGGGGSGGSAGSAGASTGGGAAGGVGGLGGAGG